MESTPGSEVVSEAARGPEYQQLQRLGRHGWWWSLLGVAIELVVLVVIAELVLTAIFATGYALAGDDVSASLDRLVDTHHVTPLGLAYLNLGLAAAIPTGILTTRYVHLLRPGALASVLGRIRWGWLAICLGLSVVTLVVTVIVSDLLPSQGGGGANVSGHVNAFTGQSLGFLLVILFLTPFQAAGEEYAFRGYLTQAIGGVFRARWVAVAVPALLFALAHGSQSVPVFFDRLAFGLIAGVLVIATGGLEAGIAMHILNNFLAFGAALLFGDMSTTLSATGGNWWEIPVTLTQSLVYLGLALWAARWRGIATRAADTPELVARNARV